VDVGSSYLPSDALAAYLWAQFELRDDIQAHRARLWHRYDAELASWAQTHVVRTPVVPGDCAQAFHMYYLLLPSLEVRSRLIAHLKAQSIMAVFHYLPLHLSDMGLRFGGQPGDCPVTEDVSDRLLRLPFYNSMTDEEQSRVIEALHAFDGWS
jgi:dTDP-4-amino-4,6-dideoxygalactose transaminase